MLQPARAKRPPPLVRKQPPTASSSSSSANSLDFSIKTLDQIRAEKRKKQQLQQQKADGDEADGREGDVAGVVKIEALSDDEQANRTTTLQSGDKDKALKEERGEEEGDSDSGKELPKLAPQKRRRVVIKRSTLRKNADSAPSSSSESAKVYQDDPSDQADSSLAPSPKKKRTTEEISTSDSQAVEPCFDATCIDRSVPLPDNNQEETESKLTILLILEQLPMIIPLYV